MSAYVQTLLALRNERIKCQKLRGGSQSKERQPPIRVSAKDRILFESLRYRRVEINQNFDML